VASLIQRERRLSKPASASAGANGVDSGSDTHQLPQLGPSDIPNSREGRPMEAARESQAPLAENVAPSTDNSGRELQASVVENVVLPTSSSMPNNDEDQIMEAAIQGDSRVPDDVPTTEEASTTRGEMRQSLATPILRANWRNVRDKQKAIQAKKRVQLTTLYTVYTCSHGDTMVI